MIPLLMYPLTYKRVGVVQMSLKEKSEFDPDSITVLKLIRIISSCRINEIESLKKQLFEGRVMDS